MSGLGSRAPVLVVGATGRVGSGVVRHLLQNGRSVRALVRRGSERGLLEGKPIHIVEGDLTHPASLEKALEGVCAVVTTAQGYIRRRGDSLKTVDDQGNRNLADAALAAGVSSFVFTSILACDQAPNVPHFHQKKLIEDYLERKGLPFVALRPGAFLGGFSWFDKNLKKGKLPGFGRTDVPWTSIHPDDVSMRLAAAVDQPLAVGKRIDLGTDRPVGLQELTALFSRASGREFRLARVDSMMALMKIFSSRMKDMGSMVDFFATGKYVANTALQAQLLPPVPTIESTVARVLNEAGLPVRGTTP
jgi:uncharacterized protein YbjT (DUF2867 family)